MLILTDGPIKTDPQSKAQRGRQTERGLGQSDGSLSIRVCLSLCILSSLFINRETAGMIFQVKDESNGQNLNMSRETADSITQANIENHLHLFLSVLPEKSELLERDGQVLSMLEAGLQTQSPSCLCSSDECVI